jgi:hypothetical protein
MIAPNVQNIETKETKETKDTDETENLKSKNAAESTLPPQHPTGGKLYYKNEIGLSGWSEHIAEATGKKYWFSSVTQESTWEEPPEVAAARNVVGHGDEVKSNNVLPRTVDAHVGKIFADDRRPGTAIPPPVIEEEAYVPVSFAKARMETMENGMKLAQKRFSDQTSKLAEYYGIVEEATQAHYLAFINGLKNKAVRRIGHYKAVLERVNQENAEYRKNAEKTINSTQAKNSQLEIEKAALMKQMKEEKIAMKKAHEEEIKLFHDSESSEAQARKKETTQLAAALKAERNDLSRVHDQVMKDVKSLQEQHKESLDQVSAAVKKLSAKMKEEVDLASATGRTAGEKLAAEQKKKETDEKIEAEEESEKDNGVVGSALSTTSSSEASVHVDSKLMNRLTDDEVAALKKEVDSLRNELASNQKALEDVANHGVTPDSDDIDVVRAQLLASQQAKVILSSRNKSLMVELDATKEKVKLATSAAEAATKAAAVSNADQISNIRGDDSTTSSVSGPVSNTVETEQLKTELAKVKRELNRIRTKNGANATGKSTVESTEEVNELRQQLEDSYLEIEALRDELNGALAALKDAEGEIYSSSAADTSMGDVERARLEAEHDSKLKSIEQQRKALEQQLAAASKAAQVAAQVAAQNEGGGAIAPAVSVHSRIRQCIEDGRKMWGNNDKDGCAKLYLDSAIAIAAELGDGADGVDVLKKGIRKAKGKPAPRAAVAVRKCFDAYLKDVPEVGEGVSSASPSAIPSGPSPEDAKKLKELQNQLSALKKEKNDVLNAKVAVPRLGRTHSSTSSSANEKELKSKLNSTEARLKSAEAKVAGLEEELAEVKKRAASSSDNNGSGGGGGGGGGGGNPKREKELAKKVKELEKKMKEAGVKERQMAGKLEKAEKKLSQNSGADPAAQKAMERRMKEMEKKAAKEMADAKKEWDGKLKIAEKKLAKDTKRADEAEASVTELQTQLKELKQKIKEMGAMGKEMEELRAQAAEVIDAKKRAAEAEATAALMTKQYKEESVLRKRYFNMMEDMKGKIRVFCRTRPMSSSEKERKCEICVDYPDEVSIGVLGEKGRKEFLFDQCFTPSATQDEVFEDASHLIQSAFDGFNVCIFAYGQSGSGKTFTMVGPPELPGLTPRAIGNIFDNKAALKGKSEVTVTCYMAELYNDGLVDLLWKYDQHVNNKHDKDPPRLDIKKDSKGMVFIKGIVTKEVHSVQDAMDTFYAGNKARHVGSTNLNAESSRSHLVFALLIENKDLMTHKVSLGKLSLVDLAGSESVGKTGATKERLKEAQSINKSLSALGDVISCLSTGQKFIPYRNNKLTMLLSDGLGGNAKTLMFVNLSPADVSFNVYIYLFFTFFPPDMWIIFYLFCNSIILVKLLLPWCMHLASN